MCGLFGYKLLEKPKISKSQHRRLTEALAIFAEERGDQSWGVAYIDNGEWKVHKEARSILRAKEYPLSKTAFFHTRLSTVGKVCEANAHPFIIDGVIGAHNGIVHNHYQLNRERGHFEVDSQHLVKMRANREDGSGASAYGVVITARPESENIELVKFNGGDLSVYSTRAGIVFASVKAKLELALEFADLMDGAFAYQVLENKVYEARQDGLFFTKEEFRPQKSQYTKTWQDYRGGFGSNHGVSISKIRDFTGVNLLE